MSRDVQLDIITETLRKPVPDVAPAHLIAGRFYGDRPEDVSCPWAMEVGMLARRIHAALYGRPEDQAERPVSPLQQAEEAKRARDLGLGGELGALLEAGHALESAPWYPARPGDIIHVHYEQAGTIPPCGETYLVQALPDGGDLLSLRLLSHSHTEDSDQPGPFESVATDDPLFELWFEAGPQRLTIVRDGRVVHDGSRPPAAPTLAPFTNFAQIFEETERYLERGDAAGALARLRSSAPLRTCGAPGVTPEQTDCARWAGHGGACSSDAHYVDPPHECATLPEELYLVMSIGPKGTTVSFDGLYEEKEAAADAASGYDRHTEAEVRTGYTFLDLPEPAPGGGSLAVIVPLSVLPDPRAEDEWAQEGRETCMEYDPDYGKDLDDE